MKKNLWVSGLIVLVVIGVLIFGIKPKQSLDLSNDIDSLENNSEKIKITKEEAEAIAGVWIHKCIDNENIKVVSYTSFLMTSPWPEDEDVILWRVGGNYIFKDFDPSYVSVVENYGDSPEVLVNASTGEVYYKHFQDIGESPIPECNF
jgi:hypothetical protein